MAWATQRIGGAREGSSETGSGVKTQGRDQEKPLNQRIPCCFADEFDRAIKAPMGPKSRVEERTSGVFQRAGTSKSSSSVIFWKSVTTASMRRCQRPGCGIGTSGTDQ